MDEAKWYVAHTYSGYENNVRVNILKTVENRNLQDQIFDVLVPVETVVEVNNGKPKTVERKIFPGYVFVKMVMNDDSWYVVRNTRGVTGFVGPGSKPVPLSPAEVRSFGIDDENGSVEETKPVVEFAGRLVIRHRFFQEHGRIQLVRSQALMRASSVSLLMLKCSAVKHRSKLTSQM